MRKTVLTRRQKQILGLVICAGKGNKEIAAELQLEYSTVRNALAAAYRVLGVSSARQLFPILERVRAEIAE